MNVPETKIAEAVVEERTMTVFDRMLKPGESYEFTENGVKFTAVWMDPADPVNRPIVDGTGFIYHWEPPPPKKVYRVIGKLVPSPLPDPWVMPDDTAEAGE